MRSRHRIAVFPAVFLTAFIAVFLPTAQAANDLGERLKACAACHGEQGRSASEAYYPSLAGKPAGYLFRQLQNFQTGRRPHEIMRNMLAYMSDDYLRDIARYYAKQSASASQQTDNETASISGDDLALGRQLVMQGDTRRKLPACNSCHADQLQGIKPDIPGLTGLRAEYLGAQLGAWQADTRSAAKPDCMAHIAKQLSGKEIQAVSRYIAQLEYAGKPARTAALPKPLPLECGAVQ